MQFINYSLLTGEVSFPWIEEDEEKEQEPWDLKAEELLVEVTCTERGLSF